MLAPLDELIDSAHHLASLLESKSLRHPDHLSLIQPITRQVKRLLKKAFTRQGRVLVHARKTGIVAVLEKEGEPPLGISSWLDNIAPLALSFTHREVSTYDNLMGRAIQKAERQLESELVSGAAIPETVMAGYLREHSLAKLSGSLAETTKQQLRSAIAEAVQAARQQQIARAGRYHPGDSGHHGRHGGGAGGVNCADRSEYGVQRGAHGTGPRRGL